MKKLAPITTTFFADELKRVRKAVAGISQDVLSLEIGYAISTIGNWECGDRPPPRGDVIAAIAKACGVSPVSLYLAAARDTGELTIDVTGLSPAEVPALLREIAEASC